MRPYQYYKNGLIGVCLVFAGSLNQFDLYFDVFLGFIVLSLFSSVGYIVNDLIDLEKDKAHPEKKFRPLASGKISKFQAIVGSIALSVGGSLLAIYLSVIFLLISVFLPISTILYSVWGKHIAILDLIMISVNYVIRAVAGCVLIDEEISPWLYICVFLFALFLVIGKRYGELLHLGEENAKLHRQVFQFYTKDFISALLYIFTASLLVAYSIYVTQSPFNGLIWTLPIFVYVILRYLLLVITSDIGRNPDKLIFRAEIIFASFMLIVGVVVSIYI